jgi:predicted enzyme related to lactoylglutathione lyase
MPPTLANGKICYLEIPAIDVRRSAEFYEKVFGWRIRRRGDGSMAFDDTTGEVSGTWVVGRPASTQPGLLVSSWSTAWPQPSKQSFSTEASSCNRSARMRPR